MLKITHDNHSLDNEIKTLEELCDAKSPHIPELVWIRGSGELGTLLIGEPVLPGSVATVRFGFFSFFIGFFAVENAVIDMTKHKMMQNIAPLHIFQIKKYLFKSMQPISRYSKNNKQLF